MVSRLLNLRALRYCSFINILSVVSFGIATQLLHTHEGGVGYSHHHYAGYFKILGTIPRYTHETLAENCLKIHHNYRMLWLSLLYGE